MPITFSLSIPVVPCDPPIGSWRENRELKKEAQELRAQLKEAQARIAAPEAELRRGRRQAAPSPGMSPMARRWAVPGRRPAGQAAEEAEEEPICFLGAGRGRGDKVRRSEHCGRR